MEAPKNSSVVRNLIRIAMLYVLPGILIVAATLLGIIYMVATVRGYFFALLCVAALSGIIIGVLMVLALMKQEGNVPKLKGRFMIEGRGSDIQYAIEGDFDSNNTRSSINVKPKKLKYETYQDPQIYLEN